MIKASELRIGILVMDVKPYDKIHKVDLNMLINAIGNGRQYRPVELTPEWLERCGFEERNRYWERQESPFFVLLKDDAGLYIGNPARTHIHTVHHLQNLVLALCGEELNVKV
jgi:hypothetical protein